MSVASTGSLLVTSMVSEPGAMPAASSAALIAAISTSFLFGGQIVQFGAGMPEITGAVLSMFTVAVARELTLSARSVQVPDADWSFPSVMMTIGAEHDAIPERSSTPENVTVTSVLFHPFAFAAGVAFAEAIGRVLSILIPSALAMNELPARSVKIAIAD